MWAAPMSPGGRVSAWRPGAPPLSSPPSEGRCSQMEVRATDPDFVPLAFSQVKCTGPLTEVIRPSLYSQQNLQLR